MSLQMFELVEPLVEERSARARLLKWNGSTYVPTEDLVTVHDYIGGHGFTRDRGYCFWSEVSERWEVVLGVPQMQLG